MQPENLLRLTIRGGIENLDDEGAQPKRRAPRITLGGKCLVDPFSVEGPSTSLGCRFCATFARGRQRRSAAKLSSIVQLAVALATSATTQDSRTPCGGRLPVPVVARSEK